MSLVLFVSNYQQNRDWFGKYFRVVFMLPRTKNPFAARRHLMLYLRRLKMCLPFEKVKSAKKNKKKNWGHEHKEEEEENSGKVIRLPDGSCGSCRYL